MAKTLSKSSWIKDVFTIENKSDREILCKYKNYFSSINQRNNLINKNDNWFFLYNQFDEDEHFEKLLTFKYPLKTIKHQFYHNISNLSYAKSITKLKGYVSSIFDDYFEAKIEDYNNSGTYEIGEFDIDDVDKGDLELLELGSVFYWNFGYFIEKGQVKKMSEIRFQRIPMLEVNEFDSICEESDKLNENIDWE